VAAAWQGEELLR
jgi:hypothetical protein